MAGITAVAQNFGAASKTSAQFNSDPTDGLMGMGYQSISQMRVSPFFQTVRPLPPSLESELMNSTARHAIQSSLSAILFQTLQHRRRALYWRNESEYVCGWIDKLVSPSIAVLLGHSGRRFCQWGGPGDYFQRYYRFGNYVSKNSSFFIFTASSFLPSLLFRLRSCSHVESY